MLFLLALLRVIIRVGISIVFAHTHAKTSLKHKPLQPNSFVKRIEIIILPISSANPAITVILDLLSPCNEQR